MIKAYAALEANTPLQPYEYDPGQLADDEVEIAVEYCGICRTDVSMINNEWGLSQYPLVPGHEVVGTISATGSSVSELSAGDVVGLGFHSGYCMTCNTCMDGDHNLCASAQPTILGHNGGFAEQVRAKAAAAIKLPSGIDKESAGPLMCGGIAVFNPLLQYNVSATDRVAVLGTGGLGHLAIQFLHAWGCEVTAFTSDATKKSDLLAMGATDVKSTVDPADISAMSGQFDFVFSTVNVNLDWNAVMAMLRPKGRLHLLGVFADEVKFTMIPMMFGQKSISSSPVGSPASIARMLDFATRHDIRPRIEKFDFANINDAISRLATRKSDYRIVLCR